MKKFIKEIKIAKSVAIFMSDDGIPYQTEKECLQHESYCARKEIRETAKSISVMDFDNELYNDAFYINTEDQLKLLNKAFMTQCKYYGEGWYIVQYHDGGDSDEWYEITSLKELTSAWDKFIKQFSIQD